MARTEMQKIPNGNLQSDLVTLVEAGQWNALKDAINNSNVPFADFFRSNENHFDFTILHYVCDLDDNNDAGQGVQTVFEIIDSFRPAAVEQNFEKELKTFLNAEDSKKRTAFKIAMSHSHDNVMKILLSKKVDVSLEVCQELLLKSTKYRKVMLQMFDQGIYLERDQFDPNNQDYWSVYSNFKQITGDSKRETKGLSNILCLPGTNRYNFVMNPFVQMFIDAKCEMYQHLISFSMFIHIFWYLLLAINLACTPLNQTMTNLTAFNITAINVTASNITAAILIPSNITTGKFTACEINGVNLVASTFSAASLAGFNIKSDNLPTTTITVSGLTGFNLTTENVAALKFTAVDLAGFDLTAAYLAKCSVTSVMLPLLNLTAVNFTAAAITVANLSATNVAFTNVNEQSTNVFSLIVSTTAFQCTFFAVFFIMFCKEIVEVLLCPSKRFYIKQNENRGQWGLFVVAIVVATFSRLGELACWAEILTCIVYSIGLVASILLVQGQFTKSQMCGVNNQMMMKSFKKLLPFLCTFLVVIIAFAVIFAVLNTPTEEISWKSVFVEITTVFSKLTGELNLKDTLDNAKTFSYVIKTSIVYLLFIMVIVILFQNLWIGKTVNDIEELTQQGIAAYYASRLEVVNILESFLERVSESFLDRYSVLKGQSIKGETRPEGLPVEFSYGIKFRKLPSQTRKLFYLNLHIFPNGYDHDDYQYV